MKYSRIYFINNKMFYSCAPELPPKDDGNWCMTLLIEQVDRWQETIKTYPIKEEDIYKFIEFFDEKALRSFEGLEIDFNKIEIINKELIEYAKLKIV